MSGDHPCAKSVSLLRVLGNSQAVYPLISTISAISGRHQSLEEMRSEIMEILNYYGRHTNNRGVCSNVLIVSKQYKGHLAFVSRQVLRGLVKEIAGSVVRDDLPGPGLMCSCFRGRSRSAAALRNDQQSPVTQPLGITPPQTDDR